MRSRPPLVVLGALVAFLWAGPLAASDLAVASNGQILRLLSGTYSDLFPVGDEAASDARVLAIEIVGSNETQRTIVPSTSDAATELSPTLYHDPTVDVTYVLWSSRHNGVHPFLRLAQLADDGWRDTIDITGSVFAVKNQPQLSVHHEKWFDSDGVAVDRTVFHVVWWEQMATRAEKRVTALILENGKVVGSTGLLTLSDFARNSGEPDEAPVPLDSTVRMLQTETGIVVGFVGDTGRIEVVTSQVLPVALSRLALAVESAILDFNPSSGVSIEQVVIDTLLNEGSEFHPATLQAMAEALLLLIEESPYSGDWLGAGLVDLADKAMPHIIHTGVRFKAGGVEGQDVSVVLINANAEEAFARSHHVALSSVADFSRPEGLPATGSQLFISKRGTAALVAWDDGDFVAYRETTVDGGWTEISQLDLSKGIDRETAYRILEERTLER